MQHLSVSFGGHLEAANEGLDDGLTALTKFARIAAGADFALVFEAGADGLALPLAADPGPVPRSFSLAGTQFDGPDWSLGPVDAGELRLPTAVLVALGRPAREALLISTPITSGERSGVLLLWAANSAPHCVCPFRSEVSRNVPLMARVFGQMLSDRRSELRRRLMTERFHDLFESLTTGIIVVESNSSTAILNGPAAAILHTEPGEVEGSVLGGLMRSLRGRCVNAAVLESTYGALQGHLDYEVKIVWDFGDRQIEVDTHPILGDGRNGRIWLLEDVTAQHKLQEQLKDQARTDPLTGLLNRRGFFDAAQERFVAGAAAGEATTVFMVDIDHFKRINDTFGHHAGDEILKAVAKRLRSALRGNDLCIRLGGEEFTMLICSSDLRTVTEIAERLRMTVAATPVVVDATPVPVTVSIGVAVQRPGDEDLESLMRRADEALYRAKEAGRNRVAIDSQEEWA